MFSKRYLRILTDILSNMTSSNQFKKIKNSDSYESEKKRINDYNKSKYTNDPEYRERIKQQAKERYLLKKNNTAKY